MAGWVALVLTLSTLSMIAVALREPTFTTFMPPSVTSPLVALTRQSRSCRLREGWRLNGSVSFEISTRSSNISEVGLPQLCSTSSLPIQRSCQTRRRRKIIIQTVTGQWDGPRWIPCPSRRVSVLLVSSNCVAGMRFLHGDAFFNLLFGYFLV